MRANFFQWGSSLILVTLVVLVQEGKSKNILVYTGCGSYSQRISVWPLVEALTEKGHHVTFISSYESKSPHPMVSDFVPKKMKEWWIQTENELNPYDLRKSGMLLPFWYTSPWFGIMVCEQLYSDPEAVAWIKQSKFDLVIIDSFMNDCAYGLAHAFQAKTIVYSTFTVAPWFYDSFGIPDDTSWVPDLAHGFPPKMNFFQRALNVMTPVVWPFIRDYWYFPKLEEITKKGLQIDSIPSISELEKNTSLAFVTTHYAQEYPRALPPNVIPIGGLVMSGKTKPLPEDMENFINKGKNGFVYISFGTVVEFSHCDPQVQKAFINGIMKFPDLQFIWKSKIDLGVKLPENFLISKWVPQQDLLAHPKIKAFVTHSGLGGITEAMYYGVPLVSFPVFAEQDYNAQLVAEKGIGIKLEILTLKSQEIQGAITEITSNIKYKQQMKKYSALFKNRPISALETALWWTEFVLQNDNTDFLRPASVNQSWWVKRQLDVWLFIFIVFNLILFSLAYISFVITKFLIRKVLGTGEKQSKKSNKQKEN